MGTTPKVVKIKFLDHYSTSFGIEEGKEFYLTSIGWDMGKDGKYTRLCMNLDNDGDPNAPFMNIITKDIVSKTEVK